MDRQEKDMRPNTPRRASVTKGGFRAHLQEKLVDQEFRVLYERERALADLAVAVGRLRKRAGLSQAELAKRAGTTQPVIARLESGRNSRIPTLPLLNRIAGAVGCRLLVEFVPPRDASGLAAAR
jgi:ribosome-binding protein aMBF1 (putative translation factor)